MAIIRRMPSMIDHYDAFISYRHSDKDIRVADMIQSDLEHFYIPSKIRKATGKKRIDRIFLDKDELGAASDLTTELSEALEHSEHLIVICSTTTKESSWVQREIEYFLRSHTRRQITTVLADGEPEDVIPDILKYEEETLTDPDGSTRTVRVPLEPLSCDYRLPRRKAKKEELPRLASKLLECSYDELMNRRRTFMIRRVVIAISLIVAAIIAFDAYLIYTSVMIRKNYESSLRNQSIYLAKESLDALESDQRVLALQLALESIPRGTDNSRPVTPQAVRALTDSTYSYTTLDGYGIEAIWTYRMPNNMNDHSYILSSSGEKLAAWDKAGNIRIWNTDTHALLFSLDRQENLNSVAFLPDDLILVLSADKITAYRLSDGSCLWEKVASVNSFSSAEVVTFPDNSILLSTNDFKLMRLDPKDGSLVAFYELPHASDKPIMSISMLRLSPSSQKIAVKIYEDVADSQILIYDIPSKATRKLNLNGYITNFIWGDEEHLIIACPEDVTATSSSAENSTYARTDHVKILCFDPENAAELWRQELTYTNALIRSDFLLLPKIGSVAYYHANKAEIYRISDGELTASHNTNDSIIMGYVADGDDWPFYVTEEGGLALPSTADGITINYHFTDNLEHMVYSPASGYFAQARNTSRIIQYGLRVCDTSLKDLKSGSDMNAPEMTYLDDRTLAVITSESPDAFPGVIANTENHQLPVLTLANSNTGEQICRIPLSESGVSPNPFSIRFLGSKDAHFYIGYSREPGGYRILDINPGTWEYTSFVLAEKETSIYWDFCTFSDGKFYYYDKNPSESGKLCVYDPDTKETTEYFVFDDPEGLIPKNAPMVIPERNSVLLSNFNETILIDLNDGSSKHLQVPDNWAAVLYAYDKDSDVFALSDRKDIRLIFEDKDEITVINCPSTPLGMCFYTNEDESFLLVPSIDGYLYRYDAKTGILLGQNDLTVHDSWDKHVEFRFDNEKGLMFLQLGDSLSIIETGTWYEETSIQRCLGYHAPGDRFYVYSHPDEMTYRIGYFSRYSVDELIKKAKDVLKNNTMPDEVKAEYGIEITED